MSSNLPFFNPLPDNKIFDWSKLKAFADEKLNVTKMIISVFDSVENIVGKGEIACRSNFSFSHNVFKRLLSQRRQEVSLCGNGLTLSKTSPGFYMYAEQVFEYNLGKGEIACNEQFLLFPQYSLLIWRTFYHFHQIRNCRLPTHSVWKV